MWRALGRDDLALEVEALEIADLPGRRGREEPILVELIRTRTAAEWEDLLNEAGVPAARVRTLDEALTSDQVASRSILGRLPRQEANEPAFRPAVAAFASPVDGPAVRSPPPRIGEQTRQILQEIGLSDEAIDDLVRRDVV
ncbi:MAG: CoA transferase [Geminicoccaceae bacterium]